MLIFDEQSHTYAADGVQYPSVTKVLAALGFYGDAVKYFTEYSRDRGSFVHKIVEYHILEELDEESIDPALQGYFEAWLRFEKETGFKPTTMEMPMHSPVYGFAGKPDLIGPMNGREAIVDMKSGAAGPAAHIQTAAYEILYGKPCKRYALQLRQDGSYKLTEHKSRGDRGIFLAALAVYQWQINQKIRGGK